MFKYLMNFKGFADNKFNIETPNDVGVTKRPLKSEDIKKRVDINVLLNKVRMEQKKEKMESTIFFGLVAAVIVVTGLIVSI